MERDTYVLENTNEHVTRTVHLITARGVPVAPTLRFQVTLHTYSERRLREAAYRLKWSSCSYLISGSKWEGEP